MQAAAVRRVDADARPLTIARKAREQAAFRAVPVQDVRSQGAASAAKGSQGREEAK